MRLTLEDRFAKYVIKNTVSGCWEWIGAKQQGGYGMFHISGNNSRPAHKVAYALLVGNVPAGMQIDHLCRNRACVNPKHLELVSCFTNLHRSPVTQATLNSSKTHCPQGHEYNEKNTYHKPKNGGFQRICRDCARAYAARYRNANRKQRMAA